MAAIYERRVRLCLVRHSFQEGFRNEITWAGRYGISIFNDADCHDSLADILGLRLQMMMWLL